jgi:hypothetical protein
VVDDDKIQCLHCEESWSAFPNFDGSVRRSGYRSRAIAHLSQFECFDFDPTIHLHEDSSVCDNVTKISREALAKSFYEKIGKRRGMVMFYVNDAPDDEALLDDDACDINEDLSSSLMVQCSFCCEVDK